MHDLDKITELAKAAAVRAGKDMAILNLNLSGKLFVLRDWNDRYTSSRELVARVTPDPSWPNTSATRINRPWRAASEDTMSNYTFIERADGLSLASKSSPRGTS
jgi:hypothetical protein